MYMIDGPSIRCWVQNSFRIQNFGEKTFKPPFHFMFMIDRPKTIGFVLERRLDPLAFQGPEILRHTNRMPVRETNQGN